MRQEAWIYEEVRFMPDMFPRGGEQRFDSGGDEKQLVKQN